MSVGATFDRGQATKRAFAGPLWPPNFKAGDFTLRDHTGAPFDMAASRGRVVVMTFLHSGCKSACPVTTQTIRGALDDIGPEGGRSDVDTIAITVNEREDTPRSVRKYLRTQHAAGFMRYLIGPVPAVKKIRKRYGIAAGEDHTAFVMLIDRRGFVRIGWPSVKATPETLANDLRILLAEEV